MKRLLHSLGLILLVCVGVRVGAMLIEPVLPMLGGLVVIVAVAVWLFSRNGSGGGGYR